MYETESRRFAELWSIRQSVQNGQFLSSLAQNPPHLLVALHAYQRIELVLAQVMVTAPASMQRKGLRSAVCCGARVRSWPTGDDSYRRQNGPLIEVDLTKRLRGRDRRAFDPREGQEIKFVKSRRPRAECPDPQRANALERNQEKFHPYRRQSAVDHIDCGTEQI